MRKMVKRAVDKAVQEVEKERARKNAERDRMQKMVKRAVDKAVQEVEKERAARKRNTTR